MASWKARRRSRRCTARRSKRAKSAEQPLDADVAAAVDEMRADYEHQLDARYAAARGFVDAIVYPEETRDVLALALARVAATIPARTSAPFVLPRAFTTHEHQFDDRTSFASPPGRASGATGSRRRAGRSRAGRSTT